MNHSPIELLIELSKLLGVRMEWKLHDTRGAGDGPPGQGGHAMADEIDKALKAHIDSIEAKISPVEVFMAVRETDGRLWLDTGSLGIGEWVVNDRLGVVARELPQWHKWNPVRGVIRVLLKPLEEV